MILGFKVGGVNITLSKSGVRVGGKIGDTYVSHKIKSSKPKGKKDGK